MNTSSGIRTSSDGVALDVVHPPPPVNRPGSGPTAYVNPRGSVADCPSGFVSTMSAEPGACGAVVAFRLPELEISRRSAGTPPIVKLEPGMKLTPVIATAVPPEDVPDAGLTASIWGPTSGERTFAASCPIRRCPATLG